MLALISQKAGYAAGEGQGQINPTLYKLAANSSTYASAFYDITSGNNNCVGGNTICAQPTSEGYSAGTGYDQVSGIGSVDLSNLANAWPATSTGPTNPTLIATTTTVTAGQFRAAGQYRRQFYHLRIGGLRHATGDVSITVDNNAAVTEALTSNGTYVYSTAFATTGAHTVLVTYVGDSTYATSTASASVTVGVASSGTGTIALATSPSTLTVAQGSSGSDTITVTPSGGYTGTTVLTIDAGTSGDNALQNLCWQYTDSNSAGNGSCRLREPLP